MIRSANQSPGASSGFYHRLDESWYIDDEGVLHTGGSAPFAERLAVICDSGGNRP